MSVIPRPRFTWLVAILLAACTGTPGAATTEVEPTSSPSTQVGAVPGGPPGGGGGGGGAGGGDSSVTREWSETVTESGGGVRSVIHQEYKAVVRVTLTKVDIHAWTITGQATITAAFTSDYESRMTTPLGPCNVHYTDDASGGGTVAVEGGLEASDGTYQFHVNIPGLDGTNDTVRDDSGCNGSNNRETTPWSVAPDLVGGSGQYTGSSISGSFTKPREGGQDAATWRFTLTN
jgi:hypothetical protein